MDVFCVFPLVLFPRLDPFLGLFGGGGRGLEGLRWGLGWSGGRLEEGGKVGQVQQEVVSLPVFRFALYSLFVLGQLDEFEW